MVMEPRALELGAEVGNARVMLPADATLEQVETARSMVSFVLQVMRGVGDALDVPFPDVEVWLLPIQESLRALAPRAKGIPVRADDLERLGGQVAGKTVELAEDWSSAAVAAPGAGLMTGDGTRQASALFGLAHELAHVVIERLGVISGAREVGWHPSAHARRKAENAARHGLDEWRASVMADLALRGAITNAAGENVAIPDVLGPLYRDSLGGLLNRVYPGWPDTVERQQRAMISLFDMWALICDETVGMFTMLSHCEAEAIMLHRASPLFDEYAQHPATRLYLGEPWYALVDCDAPLLAPANEFRDAEGEVVNKTARNVLAMWGKLGLTFTDGPGRHDLRIDVSAPLRDEGT
jgi:hypothetical protein